jgi:hypothetical protein
MKTLSSRLIKSARTDDYFSGHGNFAALAVNALTPWPINPVTH